MNLKILDAAVKNPLFLPSLVGAYSSYNTDVKPKNTLPALKLAKQLHDFSSSVVSKEKVNDIFEKLTLVSAGLGAVTQKNMNVIFGTVKALENIPNENYLTSALPELGKLLYYIPGYQISNLIQGEFVSYFLYDLQTQMEKDTYEELHRNETILKVQKFPNAENQVDWAGGDILVAIQGLRTVTTVTTMLRTIIIFILGQFVYFIHNIDFFISNFNSFHYTSNHISFTMPI